MTAPTTPRVTDCRAKVRDGQVIFDDCHDCAHVQWAQRQARREAARNGR